MIRLIVNPESEATVLTFNKKNVVIGSGPEGLTDVFIAGEALQYEHVKILDVDGHYVVLNAANDPFVTLNGLPFHKKPIKNNDIIQIGKTTLRFECEAIPSKQDDHAEVFNPSNHEDLFDTKEKLPKVLEEVMSAKQPKRDWKSSSPLPKEDLSAYQDRPLEDFNWAEEGYHLEIEESLYKMEEFAKGLENTPGQNDLTSDSELDALMDQVERLDSKELPDEEFDETYMDHKEKTPSFMSKTVSGNQPLEYDPHLNPAPFQINPPRKPTLKDYYLSEFDDENESWKMDKDNKKDDELFPGRRSNWKLIGTLIFTLLLIIAIILGTIYLTLSGRSSQEELQAAEDVADVTMALAYAQIHHINPHKQNWSDPDFLRNNLTAVLIPNYPSPATIDAHGQFSNCPYILRIYTSTDLSQFLVIAQPSPDLRNWLIPKSSIIVDSKSMELHKINDLKTLNRLLVNTNTLDGTNAMEVSNLAKQGELIPLSSLAIKKENQGFATPTALGFMRPGSENRIYNAPRYYPFGETILKKAVALAETQSSSHEVTLFKQQLEPFSKYSDIVLYSTQGMQMAMHAQKALSAFAPKEKFLIAYLVFNSKGTITSSHLLIDEESSSVAFSGGHSKATEEIPDKKLIKTLAYALESVQKAKETMNQNMQDAKTVQLPNDLDPDHPLYIQLTALAAARWQALEQISEDIQILLDRENHTMVEHFKTDFDKLITHYVERDQVEQAKIVSEIELLYKEYSSLPLLEFMDYIKAANLEPFLQEYLNAQKSAAGGIALSDNLIESHLYQIRHSNTFEELSMNVNKNAEIMTLKKIPDPEKLIAYQKKMRSEVLDSIRKLLFSPNSKLPKNFFTPENRTRFSEILKSSWISNPDEYEYYMDEYDNRKAES